jgi:predicted transcriptional regulator
MNLNLQDKKPLIALPPTSTIKTTLETLAKHSILSIPITSHDSPGKIVNIINIFDLLIFITSNPNSLSSAVEDAMTLDSDRESYRVWIIDYEAGLDGTLEKFADGSVHRGIMVDGTGVKPTIMISQSDVTSYFDANPPHSLEVTIADVISSVLPISLVSLLGLTLRIRVKRPFKGLN